MKESVVPLHKDWCAAVAQAVMDVGARVVLVSSHNEAVLLQRKALRWKGRLWVLGHLEPSDVLAELGHKAVPPEWFAFKSYSHMHYFLLEGVQCFYKQKKKTTIPIKEANAIVQAFLKIHSGSEDKEIWANLALGGGQKQRAYYDVFGYLAKTLWKNLTFNRSVLQKNLQQKILTSSLNQAPVIVAVSQLLGDAQYNFIAQIKKRFFNVHVLVYGPKPEKICVHEPGFVVSAVAKDAANVLPSQYVSELNGYACESYSDEIDKVMDLVRGSKGTIILTSRHLVFLRSIMCRMRAEHVEYWDGLGDFFWDVPDGRWVLRCARFLCESPTALSVYAVIEALGEDVLDAVYMFDREYLRKNIFSFDGCQEFLRAHNSPLQEALMVLEACWVEFQNADNKRRLDILGACVRQKRFVSSEAQDIWDDFRASNGWRVFTTVPVFVDTLKNMVTRSIVRTRTHESILCVHPNDARLLRADTVVIAGFYDTPLHGIVDEAALPESAVGLRSLLTRSGEILDFLGCLSQKRVVCTWHKTAPCGRVRSVSSLWFYAQGLTNCLEHACRSNVVVVPQKTRSAHSVEADGACMPESISATHIALLFHNPYDFYMRVILGLEVLPPLGVHVYAREEGIFVHAVMQKGLVTLRETLRYAQELYGQFFGVCQRDARWNKLMRVIADMYRMSVWQQATHVYTEVRGYWDTYVAGRSIRIVLRADRVSVSPEQGVRIGDFKTGAKERIESLLRETGVGWQLIVEGLAPYYGAIEGVVCSGVCQLEVWYSQGREARVYSLVLSDEDAREFKERLVERLAEYYAKGPVKFVLPEGRDSFFV